MEVFFPIRINAKFSYIRVILYFANFCNTHALEASFHVFFFTNLLSLSNIIIKFIFIFEEKNFNLNQESKSQFTIKFISARGPGFDSQSRLKLS